MARRRIIAAAFTIVGAWLLIRPADYTTPTLDVLFRLTPPRLWGAAFLAVAAAAAWSRVPRTVAVPLMAGHAVTWSAGLLMAALFVDGAVPTSWVWPGTLAVLIVHSAAGPPR